MLEKWVSREMFGGKKEICNFFVFVIDSLNQFGWHCEAYRTVCLPPSYLRRGIKDWDWKISIDRGIFVNNDNGRVFTPLMIQLLIQELFAGQKAKHSNRAAEGMLNVTEQ